MRKHGLQEEFFSFAVRRDALLCILIERLISRQIKLRCHLLDREISAYCVEWILKCSIRY